MANKPRGEGHRHTRGVKVTGGQLTFLLLGPLFFLLLLARLASLRLVAIVLLSAAAFLGIFVLLVLVLVDDKALELALGRLFVLLLLFLVIVLIVVVNEILGLRLLAGFVLVLILVLFYDGYKATRPLLTSQRPWSRVSSLPRLVVRTFALGLLVLLAMVMVAAAAGRRLALARYALGAGAH